MSKNAINAGQGKEVSPLAVTGITATDVGVGRAYNNGAVNLSWTLPSNSNAATLYTVTSTPSTTTQTSATNSLTFVGLVSGTSYTFTVVPSNIHGSGPSTTSSSVTATTVPSSPTGVSATDQGSGRAYNNGQASVAFSAPSYTGPGSLSYTATSSGSQSATGSGSPLTITGLSSATNYTYTVTATNSNGTSAASAASAAVTATTVPDTPSAPSASSPSAGTDTVSWSPPANGGSGITSYYLYDNGGAVGNVGNTTSYNIGEGQGSNHYFQVAAINANGQGGTSAAGNTVTTTFSFVPFGFAPFGFTPFGFTPFGFTPFGFTPYSFTPFGFTPSGAFRFTPWGNSIDVDVKVITPEGQKYAGELKVGDKILALDFDHEVPDADKTLAFARDLENWNINSTEFANRKIVETTVTEINEAIGTNYIYVDGEMFTRTHYILVKKDDIVKFIKVTDVDTSYQRYSYKEKAFVDITLVEDIFTEMKNVSIKCEPYRNFFTANMLVFDSIH